VWSGFPGSGKQNRSFGASKQLFVSMYLGVASVNLLEIVNGHGHGVS
jgi:hypothetical protein